MMALLVLSGPPLLIGCVSVCSGREVLVGFHRYTYYFADIRSEVVIGMDVSRPMAALSLGHLCGVVARNRRR
ncbi:hypothetical protein [Tessaracoccus caeni]|uniref:hypothetical protein n=1 Tax=Tessaracoccus caeni TaxID=3031239 RepID=UPI0023DA9A95|nr:hypothetical protein [Tessaracoccus caeni]MDF1489544.1 hypothetical protein [Tessaracoccus caeni]